MENDQHHRAGVDNTRSDDALRSDDTGRTETNATSDIQQKQAFIELIPFNRNDKREPDLVCSNLIKRFGLADMARRVSRSDEFNNKRKMRKSYQNQIADLPGKNQIPKDRLLQNLLKDAAEDEDTSSEPFPRISEEVLRKVFDVYPGFIPNFDDSILELGNRVPDVDVAFPDKETSVAETVDFANTPDNQNFQESKHLKKYKRRDVSVQREPSMPIAKKQKTFEY